MSRSGRDPETTRRLVRLDHRGDRWHRQPAIRRKHGRHLHKQRTRCESCGSGDNVGNLFRMPERRRALRGEFATNLYYNISIAQVGFAVRLWILGSIESETLQVRTERIEVDVRRRCILNCAFFGQASDLLPFHVQIPNCASRCLEAVPYLQLHPVNQHQTASVCFGRAEAVCDGGQQGAGVANRQDSFEVQGRIRHRPC